MSDEADAENGNGRRPRRRLPEVSRDVIERSRERMEEGREQAREMLENSKERIGETQERTREAFRKSRVRTREAADRAKRTTRKVIDTGREDISSGARIIGSEVGPRAFRQNKRTYLMRVAKLGGPVVFLATWLMALLWIRGINSGIELAIFSFLYLLPSPFGKESMIPASITAGASPWMTALSFTFVDITLVTFIAFNFDYIMMVPNLGRVLKKVEMASRKFLASKPWIRNFTMVGLFFFVMLPFQGGGGATGAVIGRVMGLKPWRIILPVALGSAVESFSLAFASDAFLSFIPSWARYLGVGILMVAVVLYFLATRRHAKRVSENEGRPS